MNLFELGGFAGGVGCAIGVSTNGFALYGWVGLFLGIPIGFIIGFVMGVLIILIIFFIGIVKEKLHERWKLKSTFGRYWVKSQKEKCHKVSSNIICDVKFEGEVICKFYYGVFLNTNHGFPALLNSYNMIDDSDSINVGDKISVFIKSLDCDEFFIKVSQKPPKIEGKYV